MTTEVAIWAHGLLCHKCWQHVGRSRWTVGVPVFGRVCQVCYAPIRQARLNPKPKPVKTCAPAGI